MCHTTYVPAIGLGHQLRRIFVNMVGIGLATSVSSSEQQVERLYMILSFRPSAGSWLGVLAYRRPCNHASQCGCIGAASCSSVTADLCGPGSERCCGCITVGNLPVVCGNLPCWVAGRCPFSCLRGSCQSEQNRVQYEQNRVVYEIEEQGGVYPVCS